MERQELILAAGSGSSPLRVRGWLVGVGDYVRRGAPLAEVEADGKPRELLATFQGFVTQLLVVPGGAVVRDAPALEFLSDPHGFMDPVRAVEVANEPAQRCYDCGAALAASYLPHTEGCTFDEMGDPGPDPECFQCEACGPLPIHDLVSTGSVCLGCGMFSPIYCNHCPYCGFSKA